MMSSSRDQPSLSTTSTIKANDNTNDNTNNGHNQNSRSSYACCPSIIFNSFLTTSKSSTFNSTTLMDMIQRLEQNQRLHPNGNDDNGDDNQNFMYHQYNSKFTILLSTLILHHYSLLNNQEQEDDTNNSSKNIRRDLSTTWMKDRIQIMIYSIQLLLSSNEYNNVLTPFWKRIILSCCNDNDDKEDYLHELQSIIFHNNDDDDDDFNSQVMTLCTLPQILHSFFYQQHQQHNNIQPTKTYPLMNIHESSHKRLRLMKINQSIWNLVDTTIGYMTSMMMIHLQSTISLLPLSSTSSSLEVVMNNVSWMDIYHYQIQPFLLSSTISNNNIMTRIQSNHLQIGIISFLLDVMIYSSMYREHEEEGEEEEVDEEETEEGSQGHEHLSGEVVGPKFKSCLVPKIKVLSAAAAAAEKANTLSSSLDYVLLYDVDISYITMILESRYVIICYISYDAMSIIIAYFLQYFLFDWYYLLFFTT